MPLSTLADTNDNLKKREDAMGKAEVSIRKTVIRHWEARESPTRISILHMVRILCSLHQIGSSRHPQFINCIPRILLELPPGESHLLRVGEIKG